MLVKRFGLAKMTDGELKTPALLRVGKDVVFQGNKFIFLGREIKRDVLFPPSIKEEAVPLGEGIFLVPNIMSMLKNTGRFVDFTLELRGKIGYDKLLYAPGTPPNLFPIMVYLGYDIFDDSVEKLEGYSLIGRGEGIQDFSEIMIQQVRIALGTGKIRELVEGIPDNKSKEILRHLDLRYYREQERFYPIWNRSLDAVSLDSLTRPDVRRWMERLKERYRKPKWAKHLLLIPCSARKPYSKSKSHREMREHIKSSMHEVILTSPLALVPRELERFYPAQNYDIPVVGTWYQEEKRLIEDMLRWYLNKFHYESIISFLPESMDFLRDTLEEFDAVMIWGRDYGALEEATSLNFRVSRKEIEVESFKILASFQFGACDELVDGARIKGRGEQVNLWKDGKRVFGYNPEKGMLTLSEESARCLLEENRYVVEIDDFYPEGDVFAAGVIKAGEEIREGDEVVVSYDGELRGWGLARMSYLDMLQQSKGKAVKLRGKPKN